MKRNGFYTVVNPTGGTESSVNDRNRFFTRGQILFQPNDKLSAQLLGHLQPGGAAPPDATSGSAPAPAVDAGKMTGRWVAQGPQDSKIMLVLPTVQCLLHFRSACLVAS